jgi:flagellar biosynthesis/type III secretory pathway ATPase
MAGCTTTKPIAPPPSVSTARVIDSLNETKEVLVEAGEQNTSVGRKIDKALTLAERLDALLEQIEQEALQQANKNFIKPL